MKTKKPSDIRHQTSDNRLNPKACVASVCPLSSVICHLSSVFCLLLLSACATTPPLPPPPPKYVYPQEVQTHPLPAANSLWHDSPSLYEDVKARRLNDLVTIKVVENITGSGTADTKASRKSTLDTSIPDLFGIPLSPTLNKGRYTFSPTAGGSMEDDFKGAGSTTRNGKLVGTITAKVVEVLPNGNLMLESRKEITINNEKQILILKGMARPDDIAVDNTIVSSKVADAELFFVGDGIIQNKQRPGWLVRFLDKVWPF